MGSRALSDHWIYRPKWQKWGRKTHHRRHSDGSEGGNLGDVTSPNDSILVSELHGSLTDLSREVKTYSFCPPDDGAMPPIIVDPPGTTQYASTSSPSPTKPSPPPVSLDRGDINGEGEREEREESVCDMGRIRLSAHSMDSEADSETFDPKLDIFDDGESFSSGLCTVFDNSMQKLRTTDHRSHSLPNVFNLGHDVIDTSCVSTTTDENTSTSVSVASMLGDSASALDEPIIERVSTPEKLTSSPGTTVNGHDSYVRTSSSTTLPASFKLTSSSGEDGGRTLFGAHTVVSGPKRWSGPGNDGIGGYESGSDIGEMDRERRSKLSPLADMSGTAWMSQSYNPPTRQRTPDSALEDTVEPNIVQRRKKRTGHGHG